MSCHARLTPRVRKCRSLIQHHSAVKHVVVTSSFASIGDFSKPATEQKGKTYTEEDWNPLTNDYCESLQSDDPTAGGTWYTASKKFAELAAWDIAKKASFKLSTICPPSKQTSFSNVRMVC